MSPVAVRTIFIAAAIVAVATLAISCSSGGGTSMGGGAGELHDGATIGKIDHLPGGTAVASDTRTLRAATCSGGRLVVQTDRESVLAGMDCNRMIPQSVVDKFRGVPVAISYNGGRLRIESTSAGTVELSVTDPTIGPGDATP